MGGYFEWLFGELGKLFNWIIGEGAPTLSQISMGISLITISVGTFLLIFRIKKVLKWGLIAYFISLLVPTIIEIFREVSK